MILGINEVHCCVFDSFRVYCMELTSPLHLALGQSALTFLTVFFSSVFLSDFVNQRVGRLGGLTYKNTFITLAII